MVTPSQLTVLITAMVTPSQFILHAFEKGVLKIPNCLTNDKCIPKLSSFFSLPRNKPAELYLYYNREPLYKV